LANRRSSSTPKQVLASKLWGKPGGKASQSPASQITLTQAPTLGDRSK
jgi:hypothetical protein